MAAATHSPRGGTVDHSKVAASNDTMILVAKLEKLGWAPAKLAQHFNLQVKMVHDWSRGKHTATEAQRTEMRKLLKKGKDFDHSPKTPEEAAKHDAEREAVMVQHGTTTPVKLEKKQPARRAQPTEDARVITVLAKENPKRPGSKAHARFALYRTGMTVGEWLEAGGTMSCLAYDLEHEFIEVK